MAMRIVYVKPELAREIAEKAVAAGVIENNEDNAQLHVEENRSALCFNDWKDYRIAAEIVSYMQGYNLSLIHIWVTSRNVCSHAVHSSEIASDVYRRPRIA